MLEKVTFKNFKSFTEETTISLLPTKSEILKNTNISNKTLKGCAFYGSNASGKTNALNAVTLLLDLLFSNGIGDLISTITLFNKERTMSFEYAFSEDNDKIIYSFEIDREGKIVKEKLRLNNKDILTRISDSADTCLTEKGQYTGNEISQSSLFLRTVIFNANLSNYPSLVKWINYLRNSIYLNPSRTFGKIITFDNSPFKVDLNTYLEKNGEKEINGFFEEFNFPYRISYEKNKPNTPTLVPFINRLKITRNSLASIPFYMESFGNQTLLYVLPSFLSVIKTGGILAIDEFSSGLHNKLEELLIRFFMEKSSEAQLLFVSHSTNLLRTDLLRPDQIYSTDLDEKGSFIRRFSDENPRETQNLEKMYLAGVFGGIPLYEEKAKN